MPELRLDEVTALLEKKFGLPEEALFFDSGPAGSKGWVCIPLDAAVKIAEGDTFLLCIKCNSWDDDLTDGVCACCIDGVYDTAEE